MNAKAQGFMIGVAVGLVAYHMYAQSHMAKSKT